MNKLLTITSGLLVASSAFAEFSMPALTVSSKVGFDTAYVSEGRREMDQNFAPSVEVGLPLFGAGELYVGLDARLKFNSDKSGANEAAPYVGFSYDVTDMFTVDFGYSYHRYGFNKGSENGKLKSVGGQTFNLLNDGVSVNKKRYSHEIYAGIMADVLLSPVVYFAYDFTQKKANIEGTVGYIYDLGSVGANGFAIDLGAKIGYSRAKKPYGIDRKTQVAFSADGGVSFGPASNLFDKKGWFYAGANADLVYSLNENTKARAGVEFAFNNAKKNSWINDFNRSKHNVWFSSAVEFSF